MSLNCCNLLSMSPDTSIVIPLFILKKFLGTFLPPSLAVLKRWFDFRDETECSTENTLFLLLGLPEAVVASDDFAKNYFHYKDYYLTCFLSSIFQSVIMEIA